MKVKVLIRLGPPGTRVILVLSPKVPKMKMDLIFNLQLAQSIDGVANYRPWDHLQVHMTVVHHVFCARVR
jgi:hypothetical protein